MNLDRFSQGLSDPQEIEIYHYCIACGKEIYVDEPMLIVDGAFIHYDLDCLIIATNAIEILP